MSAKSSLQLLKAHAIISRSWLLAQLDKSEEIINEKQSVKSIYQSDAELVKWYDKVEHTLYDVCADDHCQRYQGVTKIYTDIVRQAIEDTRGVVLQFNNKTCDTRFSKSCGGISESFENTWSL